MPTGARALSLGGGGGGGGGGFEFPPWDWASGGDGLGVGAGDFPVVDLATLDAGLACSALETQAAGKVLRLRPAVGGSVDTTMAGGRLFEVANAEDGAWLVRLAIQHRAAAAADGAPTGASLSVQVGLALFIGADLAGGYNGAFVRASATNLASMTLEGRNGASRAASSNFASGGAGSVMGVGLVDLAVVRSAAQVEVFAGGQGAWRRIGTRASGSSGVGAIGVIAATTAGVLDVMVVRARRLDALPVGVP